MNTATLKKVPLVGTPEKDHEQELSTAILACPQLIVNAIEHLKTLHEASHPASFAHVEAVAANGKRDYKQRRVDGLGEWRKAGSFDGEKDVYVAINPLYKPAREARRTNDNVSQINWLWVDIDCASSAPDWAYETVFELEMQVIGVQLPEPTLVVSSGRGLWLMWQISSISPRNKISMRIWRKLMSRFGQVLLPYGADKASTDPARLMRLAGSVNGKSGQRVSIQRRGNQTYNIEELAERYLPAVRRSDEGKRTGKATVKSGKPKKATGKPRRLHTAHSLFYNRSRDIEKLVALRNGEMSGYRNKTLFIYAVNCLQYHTNSLIASQRVTELNETFTDPLGSSEIAAIMTSAEDQERWWRNATVIEWLDMSADEQAQMVTIIGKSEKRKRNTISKREKRGGISKSEKDAQRAKEQMEQIATLREAIAENPDLSNVKLGKALGWSESKIRRLRGLL